VAASDAYLRVTMTRREDVIGRGVFEVFPENPEDTTTTGMQNLTASLERVVKDRITDTMAVQRYDIRRPKSEGGQFEERYWSPSNSPVFAADNSVSHIIHHVEDVTDFVRLKRQGKEQELLAQQLHTRGDLMEAEVIRRAQQIQAANEQLREANRELTSLRLDLERRVQERTAELAAANSALQTEIGERRQIETTLRASEGRLQAVLNHTFDAIISIDDRGRIMTFNGTSERLFGYLRAEVIGKNVNMLMPEPYHGEHDRYLADYLRTGQGKIIGIGREVEGRRKDGSTFPLDLAVTEFRLEQGERRHFIGIVRDLTQRKLAEEHRARFAQILEATPDFVGIADAHRKPIFINGAGRKIVGLAPEEDVSHSHINDYFPGWAVKIIEEEGIPSAIQTGTWTGETAVLTRAGQEIPVSQVIVVPKTPDGQVRYLATIMRDLTEQKKLEQQFRQAQKMEAVGQLAGGVAHDFNNLLTIISGYSDILLSRLQEADPLRQSVKAISDAGGRAAALTRQLLAFSRQTVLDPRVLNLNDVVRETEKMLRRLIGEDIALTAVLDSRISRVKVDPGQLDQVLMNLSVNARDAMPKGGKLTLETREVDLDPGYAHARAEVRAGRYVMLAVTDTGCGMPSDVMAHIFEPFFTTKGVGKGTGLGLSVVHGIVKQSGGHIEVYSELTRGTTFKLYFPAVEKSADIARTQAAHVDPRGSETLLLVEDEDGVRGLAMLALQEKGYHVLEARDGNEAMRIAEKHGNSIHLLLTDVVMPGMDGRELAEKLRPRFPNMKVLFSSGYTDDSVVRHGILEAEVAFLQKPYSLQALAGKVRQVLDSP